MLGMTVVGATAIASFLYVSAGMAFQREMLGYGFGFALFGVFLNVFPPVLVWACARWIR